MTSVQEGKPLLSESSPSPSRSLFRLGLFAALVVAVLVIIFVLPGENSVSPSTTHSGYDEFTSKMEAMMDRSVDPCTDFYQYACGGWAKTATIPPTASSIDTSFTVVQKANNEIIRRIIDDNPPEIAPYYTSCLNASVTDKASLSIVQDRINAIFSLKSKLDVVHYAGQLQLLLGVSSFAELDVQADPKNASVQILSLNQGGWTLPTIEFYGVHDNQVLFEKYVHAIAPFVGRNLSASALWAFESAMASHAVPDSALRDPIATYIKMDYANVSQSFPHIHSYLTGVNISSSIPSLLVPTPNFFAKTKDLINATSLLTLQQYVALRTFDTVSTLLGEEIRAIDHAFNGVLSGLSTMQPRDAFCQAQTLAQLPDFVGQAFQAAAFPDAQQAETLVHDIENAMSSLLQNETWLDDATRAKALDKVAKIRNFIGGPTTPPTLPFTISPNASDYFATAIALIYHDTTTSLNNIGKPADPNKWDMGSFIVDAYNDPSANKMVFPAGILQPPIFSATVLPMIANYARIGVVMGHELTHGFDDEGRLYDSLGQLNSWWTDSVAATFTKNAKCLVEQYNSFPIQSIDANQTILGHVDGALTLGENIADNGGVKLAYLAYSHRHGELSANESQLFFTSFAQGWWCQKRTDNLARVLMHTDPHSPGKWRLQGPLMNSPYFSKAFNCPVGSPMNPEKKCVVW